MARIRVYELAKSLDTSSKEIIKMLSGLGLDVKNHMSTINEKDANIVKEIYQEDNKHDKKTDTNINVIDTKLKKEPGKSKKDGKGNKANSEDLKIKKSSIRTDKKEKINDKRNEEGQIEIEEGITVKILAEKIKVSPTELIKKLISKRIMANINQSLNTDDAVQLAEEYGYSVIQSHSDGDDIEKILLDDQDDETELLPRSPVVTVMGHVDHGKTSLLDKIRKTKVTEQEAGGITQHIGAYKVRIGDREIVFLDTPGHEAFTAMRARGAQVTDIAVLVVAADDGVMPQTVEAINHSKAANIPIIVAVNKIDKANANPDRVNQQLAEYGLIMEEWGGETVNVPVSARTGQGIDTLLDMILLITDMMELKANPSRKANGTVIEGKLEKGRGPVATVLIQNGTLGIGDPVIAGVAYGKVRAMMDEHGKRLSKAGPSVPVEVSGLSEVPEAGDKFYVVKDDKTARQVAENRKEKLRQSQLKTNQRISLDDLFEQIREGKVKDLNVIVKSDVQGSMEAIKQSLEKLDNDEVHLKIIHGGVGAITETDVMLAAASNAIIIGFNVRPNSEATQMANEEKVDIRTYRVIYEAINDMKAAIKGMLEPEFKEVVVGKAEVRVLFKISSIGTIAGCYVTEGKILRNGRLRVVRDGVVVYEGVIDALKRFKDDVKEVMQGYECGISMENFNDFKEGDILENYIMEEVPR